MSCDALPEIHIIMCLPNTIIPFLNFLFTDNNDTSEFTLRQSTGNSQININDNKKNI